MLTGGAEIARFMTLVTPTTPAKIHFRGEKENSLSLQKLLWLLKSRSTVGAAIARPRPPGAVPPRRLTAREDSDSAAPGGAVASGAELGTLALHLPPQPPGSPRPAGLTDARELRTQLFRADKSRKRRAGGRDVTSARAPLAAEPGLGFYLG